MPEHYKNRATTTAITLVALLSLIDTMSAEYTLHQLPGPLSTIGAKTVWDVDSQSLFYVDINVAAIRRYDYAENKTYSCTIDGVNPIAPVILVKGKPNNYVVGSGNKLLLVTWDGRSEKGTLVKTLYDLGESEKHVRFNEGKVDPKGRLYAGTMQLESLGDPFQQHEGKLYRFDGKAGGEFKMVKDRISISNGLAWNESSKKLYYIDTGALDIKEFDVLENGDLQNETILYDWRVNGEGPGYFGDGMTNDEEGNLYVATWGGSKVQKINPRTKAVELEIDIPAKFVTTVAFGGPKLDELFVATARLDNQSPPAGALFKVTGLGVRGKPMTKMLLQN
ncbi:regucalcin-like isoform X2 [Armigeres subalbatus]|uniref:regucalcin-like isoform X2 n=1 Tax=Armigeres subalbatus TaxID=124917 RepID=UPI002ED608FB